MYQCLYCSSAGLNYSGYDDDTYNTNTLACAKCHTTYWVINDQLSHLCFIGKFIVNINVQTNSTSIYKNYKTITLDYLPDITPATAQQWAERIYNLKVFL